MGLETGVQNPLGRIDVAALAPRPDVVVEPRTALAMQAAFQQAQELQNQQHDRSVMAPAVEARARLAADPAMIDAAKRQTIAGADETQMDVILKKQQALAAAKALGMPPGIGHLQEDLIKQGVFIMPEQNEQPTDFASRVQHTWRKHEAWKTEVAANEANLQGVDNQIEENAQGKFVVKRAKGSGRPLDPKMIAKSEEFKAKFGNRFQSWDGTPAPDMYGSLTPGTVEAAPAAAPATGIQDGPMYNLDGTVNYPPAPAAPTAGAPAGSVPTQAGFQIGPASAGIAGRAPTEIESRAKLALVRFQKADPIFSSLAAKGFNPAAPKNVILSVASEWFPPAEAFKGEDLKSYDSARLSWVQGLLRMESGASINKDEELKYTRAFFPRLNDPPAVQKQKANLRAASEQVMAEIASGGRSDPDATEQKRLTILRAKADAIDEISNSPEAFPIKTVDITGRGPTQVQKGPDGKSRIVQSGSSTNSASSYVAPATLKGSKAPVVEPKMDPRKATKNNPLPDLIDDPMFK